jgi:hypothetical protein
MKKNFACEISQQDFSPLCEGWDVHFKLKEQYSKFGNQLCQAYIAIRHDIQIEELGDFESHCFQTQHPLLSFQSLLMREYQV